MTQTTALSPEPPVIRHRSWVSLLLNFEPAHLLVPVIALVTLYIAARPVSDIDTYWHVLIGQEILAKHSVTGLGDSWALFGAGQGWQTTQWLSEAGMFLLYRAWGWHGITAATFVLSAIVVVSLGWLTLRGRPARITVLVYALEALPLSDLLISRPQIVSLVFLLWLAHIGRQMSVTTAGPRPVLVGMVTAAWANFHGYWVLAPAFLFLGTLGALADDWRAWPRTMRRWVPVVLASLVGGCLTPIGVRGLLMPFRFHEATSAIIEWAPTTFASPGALGFLTLMLLTVWAWARTRSVVPRSELIMALGVFSYSTIAMRNVVVAAVLLTPLFADRLSHAWTHRSAVSRRETRALVTVIVLVTTVGSAVVLTKELRVQPLAETKPLGIAAYLHEVPGDKRILNDYNTAGPLLIYGPGNIRLAIDGRADRNGATWIAEYQNAMALRPGWQVVLTKVRPDYAVLAMDSPLPHVLEKEDHWHVLMTDQGYVLLAPAKPRP